MIQFLWAPEMGVRCLPRVSTDYGSPPYCGESPVQSKLGDLSSSMVPESKAMIRTIGILD